MHEVLKWYCAVCDKVIWRDRSIVEHGDAQTITTEGIRRSHSTERLDRMSSAWWWSGPGGARRRLSTRTGLSAGRLQPYPIMGFLTILKKLRQKEKEMRILMLGLDNAGKTTILKRFNGEPIDTISPTLGFNIKTLEHKGYKLNIWDVGGQKSLRSYWKNYFESTDGVTWVVDSADPQRLADCARELHSLLREERLAGATLLVLANKADLPGALSLHDIRQALDLDSIKTHHWRIERCSAVTGENLIEGVNWMLDDIASRIFTLD